MSKNSFFSNKPSYYSSFRNKPSYYSFLSNMMSKNSCFFTIVYCSHIKVIKCNKIEPFSSLRSNAYLA